MISSLYIQNFKSISELTIPMSKITILAGMNSSGKSSVIQAIRMLERHNHCKSVLLPDFGDLHHIARTPSKPIVLECERISTGEKSNSRYEALSHKFQNNNIDTSNLQTDKNQGFDNIIARDPNYPNCIYIGADRLGPKNYLPSKDSSEQIYDFGENCEYVYEFIERFRDSIIAESVRHHQARGDTLYYNIIGWLQEISPGANFQISSNRRYNMLVADFNGHTPIHVGFGLSCVLPIIVAALGITIPYSSTRRPILLIENPEAHLHPQGQTKMAELVALATKQGLQIVVETHSDHFIDGIRLAVKEKQINCTDVAIHYFSKTQTNELDTETTIESPVLNESGKLDFWPDGFGDQMMINHIRLARK